MHRRAFIASLFAVAATSAQAEDELRSARDIRTDFKGAARNGRLVVVVMKGAWCPVCVGQLDRFAKLGEQLHRLNAQVVGLNADSPADNLVVEKKLGVPILSDPDGSTLRGLGLWRDDWGHPMPAVLVFDRCGEERGRVVGRRPGLRDEEAVIELLKTLALDPARCGQTNT